MRLRHFDSLAIKTRLGFSTGFSLLEMLVVMSLIAALTAMAVPCWGVIARHRAKRVATSLVMDSLEQARQSAVTGKHDVWVVFQHPCGTARDSLRILSKEGTIVTTLGPWQALPGGITFACATNSLMGLQPPTDLSLVAFNGKIPASGALLGSVMFQRSGRIGAPLPGGNALLLGFDAGANSLPESITLSRATGRATLQ